MLQRLAIGVGIALAVIAPVVVAFAYAGVVGDFGRFHAQEGWETSRLPALTNFVFKCRGLFVVGLLVNALSVFCAWLYVARKHRHCLLVATLAILACSLYASLVSLLMLLLAVWLPVVARIPCC